MVPKDADKFIASVIATNPIVIFSKSYCPYCRQTKEDIANYIYTKHIRTTAYVFELNEYNEGDDIHAALIRVSNQDTVPNVYVNGEHIGGGDKTREAIKNNTLHITQSRAIRKTITNK